MPNQTVGIELLIDGDQDLKAQENQINYAELAYSARLVTCDQHTGTPPNANLAVFLQVASQPKPLQLILLGAAPVQTLSAIVAAGQLIVFHSTISVNGKPEGVVGVR